jgi:hypothetical protein
MTVAQFSDPQSAYLAEMMTRFGRVSKARRCPLVVAGRRCRRNRDEDGEGCLCEEEHYQSLFDHGRMWLDRDGTHILTGEPYNGFNLEHLVMFERDVKPLHLTVTISRDSPWNPGRTTLLIVRRASAGHQ